MMAGIISHCLFGLAQIKLPRHIWTEGTGGHLPRQPGRAVPLKRKPAASNWTEQEVKEWVRVG
jgi:hypothetical protein